MVRGYGCVGGELVGCLIDVARLDRDVSKLVVEYVSAGGWWVRLGCFEDPTRVALLLEPDWHVCDLPRFPVVPSGIKKFSLHFVPSTGHLYGIIQESCRVGYVLDMNSRTSEWEELPPIIDDSQSHSDLREMREPIRKINSIDMNDDGVLRANVRFIALPYEHDPFSRQWRKCTTFAAGWRYDDDGLVVSGVHWRRAKSLKVVDTNLFRQISVDSIGPIHLRRGLVSVGKDRFTVSDASVMYVNQIASVDDEFFTASYRQLYQSLCLDSSVDYHMRVVSDRRSVRGAPSTSPLDGHVLRFERANNTWHDLGESMLMTLIGPSGPVRFQPPLRDCGYWTNTTAYKRYDTVTSSSGNLSICLCAHTNNNPALDIGQYWMRYGDFDFYPITVLAASSNPIDKQQTNKHVRVVISHRDDLKLIEYETATPSPHNAFTAPVRKISERVITIGGAFRPQRDHFIAFSVPYCPL